MSSKREKWGKQSWKPGNMLNPVPAVMVSCADREGKPNIITIAWAARCAPIRRWCRSPVRPTRYSYDMIRETGEFVINLVSRAADARVRLLRRCEAAGMSTSSRRPVSRPSRSRVSVPGIAKKARSASRVPRGRRSAPSAVIPFLAEVAGVTADDRYLDETGPLRHQRNRPHHVLAR